MKKFKAVTESGTTYQSDGFLIKINSPRDGYYAIRPWTMRVVSEDEIKDLSSAAELHVYVRDLPPAEVPEVGKRFYVSGRDGWRLSTWIETVEVYE